MQPIDTVKDIYAAFGRGDIEHILAGVAADTRWALPGDLAYSGVYTGRDGVAEFFRKMLDVEEFEKFEPREFLANGDLVVALRYEQCRSRVTGNRVSTNWSMMFRVKEGKIAAFEAFFDTAAYSRAHRAGAAAGAA